MSKEVFEIPDHLDDTKVKRTPAKKTITPEQKQKLIENLKKGREKRKANLQAAKGNPAEPKLEEPKVEKVIDEPKEVEKVIEEPKEVEKVIEELKEVEKPKEVVKVIEEPKETPKVVEVPKEIEKSKRKKRPTDEEVSKMTPEEKQELLKSFMDKIQKNYKKKNVKAPEALVDGVAVKPAAKAKPVSSALKEPVKALEKVIPPVIPKLPPFIPKNDHIVFSTLKKSKWA